MASAAHGKWFALYRELLALRHRLIVPRLSGMRSGGDFHIEETGVLRVQWTLGEGSRLHLVANFAAGASGLTAMPAGQIVYASSPLGAGPGALGALLPWTVAFTLEPA
jgi:1,4-alpha-glucan branching enzyme